MTINDIKQKTSPVFRKYQVNFAGIFGSTARGDNRPDSDVDFLVNFGKIPSLVQFIKMEEELGNILQTKVDLVVQGSEKPLIRASIYKDLVEVYGQRPPV